MARAIALAGRSNSKCRGSRKVVLTEIPSIHLVMLAQTRGSSGDRIGTGVNLASCRGEPPSEFEHVPESGLEFLAVCRRQAGDPRHALVA
jgi:hypothetical protein